ncbi:alpha/beta hydrolase family protein [Rheinheimera sp. 4Y26]|uniref:alpha/beta hydrolase family protein n=1 Tax=Rheinheimera sp. 4Y26 TaxID=2977811 RepID=UPI0021B10970|nr:hypothetical protein [Rheinheimera sp. 4Y26]MCT6700306.1 hypothetical protein [Rheinheimera sp. 4Y26]
MQQHHHRVSSPIRALSGLFIGRKLLLPLFTVSLLLGCSAISNSDNRAQQEKSKAEPKLVQAGFNVKMQQLDLFDATRQRPVKITLWYPEGKACKAQICLADNTVRSQALLLSHGAMGAALNYQWLGKSMAGRGWVTVGVNHYGESWVYGAGHIKAAAVLEFWQRPLDLGFVLDQLEANQYEGQKLFNQSINWRSTVAVGHSSGGASVAALAGAGFDFAKVTSYCKTDAAKADRSCAYLPKAAAGQPTVHKAATDLPTLPSDQDWYDARVKKLMLLDPALGHLVDAKSLQQIKLPTLVAGSVQNDFLPFAQHAGFYASQIPQAQQVTFNQGEGHFVYLDSCTLPHRALGVPICFDKAGVNRSHVQQQLTAQLLVLLSSTATIASTNGNN